MPYKKGDVKHVLSCMTLGSSVAEQDELLESARVETSVLTDLLNDKVDLIPGTKGSGKSALYRIFVDFLPDALLQRQKVVIAHGVQSAGDSVFHVHKMDFGRMNEDEFVNFWCIYLVSLANEHFVKGARYSKFLKPCSAEVQAFRQACKRARIPEFEDQKSLRDVLGWVLAVMGSWRPKVKYRPPGHAGEVEVLLFETAQTSASESRRIRRRDNLPQYVHAVKQTLESLLEKAGLSLWLMIDRLDEIFPRRSPVETRALRGLLRTLRIFESSRIRLKVFLRDDIFEQVVADGKGFTALTHITARQADTLRWSPEQILTMIVKRLYASENVRQYLKVDLDRLSASRGYREKAFYKVFPPTVDRGSRRSSTLRWIYNHTADGRGVVTPRDVIDLLTKARQRQQDEFGADISGETDYIIGSTAIKYGLRELSKRRRTTFLEAEFPHLLQHIIKFVGGKAEYDERSMIRLFGKKWASIADDLVSIGLLRRETKRDASITFKIPFVYREGLEVTQGKA